VQSALKQHGLRKLADYFANCELRCVNRRRKAELVQRHGLVNPDREHTRAHLGNSVISSIQWGLEHVIARVCRRGFEFVEDWPVPWTGQSNDVLKNEELRRERSAYGV
jgi:hypothetical protein